MPLLRSWVESANSSTGQFPLNNLPYGVFARGGDAPRCGVAIEYRNGTARCELALGDAWRITPDDQLIRSLHEWLRPENVEFQYA